MFPIWITFENRSKEEVRDLRFVDFRTAGLKPAGRCWRPIHPGAADGPRYPACIPNSVHPQDPGNLPDHLAPGESVTVTADLVRTERSGEFMLTGLYSWTDPTGRQHRMPVPIGPIEVTKDWENWKARMREDLPAVLREVVLPVLKDLALPFAAFLLGLFLRFGEERRAAFQQTWNQMLPQIHGYTADHFLPISAAASEAIAAGKKTAAALKNDPKADTDEAFYRTALLFRRMRSSMQKIGGFYLKDRDGEEIVVGAWNVAFDEFVGSLSSDSDKARERLDFLTESIGDQETFREYRRKLSGAPSYSNPFPGRSLLADVRDAFVAWIQKPDFGGLVLPMLDIFATSIDYEINRPYDRWYTRPYAFDSGKILRLERDLKRWLKTAPEGEKRETIQEIRKSLARYGRRNAGRSWPLGTRWVARLGYTVRALKAV